VYLWRPRQLLFVPPGRPLRAHGGVDLAAVTAEGARRGERRPELRLGVSRRPAAQDAGSGV